MEDAILVYGNVVDFTEHKRPGEDFSQKEIAVLRQINTEVAAANSIEEIIDFILKVIHPLGWCDRVGIAFIEENEMKLVSHYCVANYEHLYLSKGFSQDLIGSSLEKVINDGKPRIINDLELYAEQHPESVSTRLILKEGILSSMTCPLEVDGRQVGVLFISSGFRDCFGEDQLRLYLAIAERLSQAIEKTYRIEQLEYANKAYFEMLGFVSHELKHPVAAIMTNAQLLYDGYLGDLDEKQKGKLDRIISTGASLLNLVRDYLELSRVEGGDIRCKCRAVENIIADVIEPSIEMANTVIEQKIMQLHTHFPEKIETVQCDPGLLRIVVSNLLSNAAKYGRVDGNIELSASFYNNFFELTVWNEGAGFPEEKKSQLFKRFSRINTPELMKQSGTGVGLYTSWRIIQLHHGRIWADSEHGKWARFTFRIPQQPPEK